MKTAMKSGAAKKTKSSTGKAAARAAKQPAAGKVTRTAGTVEWKFGVSTFRGALVPKAETEDRCFAKTHNGNLKILAKGKNYWRVV